MVNPVGICHGEYLACFASEPQSFIAEGIDEQHREVYELLVCEVLTQYVFDVFVVDVPEIVLEVYREHVSLLSVFPVVPVKVRGKPVHREGYALALDAGSVVVDERVREYGYQGVRAQRPLSDAL